MTQQNIHWFPGHMMKALRMVERELPNVDMVIELLDARAPSASKNEELTRLAAGKPRLLLLNKSDLADSGATARWLTFFHDAGYGALAVTASDRKNVLRALETAIQLARGRMRLEKAKPRAMIIGAPNVGKSTFINALSGRAATKTADKPGVTRGKQWVTLERIELLDMPGILPRKLEERQAALLAFTGAIRDDILDTVDLAVQLLGALRPAHAGAVARRYKLTDPLPEDNIELLTNIARARGMLLTGGEMDLARAAAMLLDELRGGKLGRVTFELPAKEADESGEAL